MEGPSGFEKIIDSLGVGDVIVKGVVPDEEGDEETEGDELAGTGEEEEDGVEGICGVEEGDFDGRSCGDFDGAESPEGDGE